MTRFSRLSLASELHGFSDALHWLALGIAIAALFVAVDWLTRRHA